MGCGQVIVEGNINMVDEKAELRLFDYQQKKFEEEKGMIPGPGHYNIQAEQNQHMANLRKASDKQRFKAVTAA